MKYTIISLFPHLCEAYFESSIMAKAIERGIISYTSIQIRDYALDKHKTCDDAPYGGGAGMILLPEPLGRALQAAGLSPGDTTKEKRVIYLSPSGRPFNQALARELAQEKELVLICGRYEGIDQRIIDTYVDDEISVGDYVLSSGDVAALVLIDATYRLVGEVISAASLEEESFSGGLLEYPQYTRPEIYDTLRVPEILLSGHHGNIKNWRLEKRVEKTLAQRPDLIRSGIEAGLFNEDVLNIIAKLGPAVESP